MNCKNCGANVPDNVKYCPKCGSPVEFSREAQPDDFEKTQSLAGNYPDDSQQFYDTPPVAPPPVNVYQQAPVNAVDPTDMPVSIGAWIGVFVLNCIPLVNLIMLFVWAFSSTTKKSLKNYARAVLILFLIGIAIGLIVSIIIAVTGVRVPVRSR